MTGQLPVVHLTEESLREGMQIESVDITVDQKLALIAALAATGLRHIVVGSFVSPRYTPQMAQMDELVARLPDAPDVRFSALALNSKGRERAAAFTPPLQSSGEPPYTYCHLCDTFTRRNANISRQQEIDSWPETIAAAVAAGADRAGIGANAVFGSNFEGEFALERTLALLHQQQGLWEAAGVPVDMVWLGDPMSWCTPHRMKELLGAVRAELPGIKHFYLHLHDGRGLALATSFAAIEALTTAGEPVELYLDTAIGGIGGCPYCGNGRATGLVPTEDMVNLLNELGIATGVDLDRLIQAVWMLEEILGRPSMGHVSKVGPMPRGGDLYDPNLPVIETFDEARHFLLGAQATDESKRPWREPIPSPEVTS
jgi:hydroxymethylglutaryl-CoA lyase